MRIHAAFIASAALLVAAPALSQEVSDSVKQTCRSVSTQTARTIVYALRANIDPATQVKRVPDTWLEGVQAHMLLAASREVQRRIELYWRQESDVVYPPIDERWLEKSEVRSQKSEEYFLIVSTLAEYKRIDLAVEACNQLKAPLKIVGEGPALASLKRIAGPTIEFLGYRPHVLAKKAGQA